MQRLHCLVERQQPGGFEMEKVGVDYYIKSTSILALYAIAPPI